MNYVLFDGEVVVQGLPEDQPYDNDPQEPYHTVREARAAVEKWAAVADQDTPGSEFDIYKLVKIK